jgi:hypothetical protein
VSRAIWSKILAICAGFFIQAGVAPAIVHVVAERWGQAVVAAVC